MPTIGEIYRMMKEHEETEKTAAVKTAIDSPQRGQGQVADETGAVLEDVLGGNVAETKIRIKKKLEAMSGQQAAAEGVASEANEESINSTMTAQVGEKMPPTDPGASAASEAAATTPPAGGVAAKVSALLGKKEQEKAAEKPEEKPAEGQETKEAETEKSAEEKLAEEYYAAGQIMAHGFVTELNSLVGTEK